MPLTITDYKNWARQDQATTVSLTRDSNGIMAEKDRLGFLARTFGGSLKTVRAAVIKDFTRALSARYGSSIAQQAVSIAGLTPTTKLKGWKITEAIQAAKVLRAQMLMSGDRAPDIRLGDSDVPSEVTHFFLADKGNAVNKFLKQRATAVQLLGEMPLTEAEFSDFHARIGGDTSEIQSQAALTMSRFIAMLERGDYRQNREVTYYASELCIAPKYLSEISKSITGNSANWWINRFTILDISRQLRDRSQTFTEISELFNFSSPAYFSRYVQRYLGESPSDYRG